MPFVPDAKPVTGRFVPDAPALKDPETPDVGIGETLLHLATGAAGGLGGGLTYLGTLAATQDPQAAEAVRQATQEKLTYQPRSQMGQQIVGGIGKATQKVADFGDMIGERTAEKYGPLAGALHKAGLAAIPMVMGVRPAAAAVEGATSSAGAVASGLGDALAAPVNALRPSKIGEKYISKHTGSPEQQQALVDALRKVKPVSDRVENSGPTAAQAVSDIPEGTTVQAIQQAVSQSPKKGISADFAQRFAAQEAAVKAAKDDLDIKTEPLRTVAIDKIKANGGVEAAPLVDAAESMSQSPVVLGTPIAGQVLTAFRKLLRQSTGVNGRINPDTLYQFRKTGLDQVIKKAANGDADSMRFARINVAKGIQDAIDNSFFKDGGSEWKNYLKEYSKGRAPISALEKQTEEMYAPFQRTNASGTESAMAGGLTGPSLFSRPTAILNYTLGLRGKLLGNAVNRHVADTMLDPSQLADVLQKTAKRNEAQQITDPSRLLPERTGGLVQNESESISSADRAARPWGDAAVAPESRMLPQPGKTVGGSNFTPRTDVEHWLEEMNRSRLLADALHASPSEISAMTRHPSGSDLAGPRLRTEMTADVPPPFKAEESYSPPVDVALAKVMAAAPQLSPLIKALITSRNKLPGRTGPVKLFEDDALSLEPVDKSPAAQSAAAARERGRKLEEAILGRKRK